MGSPETCEKCGGVGRHVEGKRGFTRFPCPNATPTPPAPDAGARIEEAHRALGKPGRMDDDGCCVGCGRSVQPSPCCPDFPVWPGPCRSCYAYDEEQRDAGAAERAVGEARDVVVRFAVEARNHGTFPVNRDGVIDQTSAVYQSYIATLADLWRSVDAYSAALRGTNQGDQPKAGHEAEGREGA